MKRLLLFISIILFLFSLLPKAWAQTQTVTNGAPTTAVNFPGTGCSYTWTNNTPGIGLAANGIGNVPSFTAVNTGTTPIKATITATPMSSGFAYVTDESGNTVSVISTSTHSVLTTIPVGTGPWGEALSLDGTRLYVTNASETATGMSEKGSVSVISTVTNAVIATIPVGLTPLEIVVSPDGTRVYVSNINDRTISVINTTSNTVIATIPAYSPLAIAISPDGKWLYVTNNEQHPTLTIINTTTYQIAFTTAIQRNPIGIAISHDGSHVYIANNSDNTVTVFNTQDNTLGATINVGQNPYGIAVSPDDSKVFVANNASKSISVLNAGSSMVIATIPTSSAPYGLSVSPDGKELYVAEQNSDVIQVFNTSTYTVIANITSGIGDSISIGNFVSAGPGCNSSPVTFTITVNPTAALPPTISASTATGAISACTGSASTNPNLQQFNVSGSNLTGNITAKASAGFEISMTPGSGYGNSVTLTQTGGSVSNTIIYVRSAASDPVGNISGNVTLTSAGASAQNVAVKGIVNALPTVNTINNQTVVNGTATTAINFTGTGNSFTWTNNAPGIGLPASGTGNIAAFTGVNTGTTPVIATITATSIFSGYAYIANSNSNTVSVINTSTNAVIKSIPVGMYPFGEALSPDGSTLYVTNSSSSNVSVISTLSNTVIATIPVGSFPTGVAVSADGNHVFISNSGSGTVSVINAATNQFEFNVQVGGSPQGITVSHQNPNVFYVANGGLNIVSVVDISIDTPITNTIPVSSAYSMALSPDDNTLYVTDSNTASNFVYVVNLLTGAIVTKVAVGSGPLGICVSPDGSRIYAANYGSNTVSVINSSGFAILATIPVGKGPDGVSISPDGKTVYVSSITSSTVAAINTTTNTVISTIPVGLAPYSFGNFVTNGASCTGAHITFTITVNPTSVLLPTISAGTATGNISACEGSPSASPDIAQFTVSGSNLTGNITAQAPANFEISLTSDGGYGNSVILNQVGGKIDNVIVYVRSAATATGSISGNVILSSAGAANQSVAVIGIIDPLPTVNPVQSQTVKDGDAVAPVYFTGTGNFYQWTNNNTDIGLPASGTGPINSYIAVNKGTTPITATITATPYFTGFAYIGNDDSQTIAVINTSTQKLVSTIPTDYGPESICVSPDYSKVYVGMFIGKAVLVIDNSTNKVIANIPMDDKIWGICISPDGSKIYAASINGEIHVIDAATNKLISTANIGVLVWSMVITPDGKYIYATDDGDGYVNVINTSTLTLTASIRAGIQPAGIAITPDGKFVYAANNTSSNVSVISTATNKEITEIFTGVTPVGVAISKDGKLAYVTVTAENAVKVISTETNKVIATLNTGEHPFGISVSPDGSQLYVANATSNDVSVFSIPNNTLITTIAEGTGNFGTGMLGNFITAGRCSGAPVTFTITINPNVSTPTITGGTVTGTISACAGSPSASPYIEQFDVLGSDLTADVTVTAPTGFEVSLSANSGYGSSVIISQVNGNVNNITVYVRSSASAAAGSITGNVVLSSKGATDQNIPVTGTVNTAPTVNAVSNQTLTSGSPTQSINFTGTATSYSWTNDNPSIGLSANGNGDINSFTAVNSSTIPVTATITVTPLSQTATGCDGAPVTFTITVNPTSTPPVTDITVPNTFTPNGDGINDVWRIQSLDGYPQCMVSIYTRYGNLIYQSRGYPTPWDGTYKGSMVPTGTYYYIIYPQPDQKPLAGWVAVLR